MIKVTVFYPNEEGKSFDMEYYCNNHIPMCQQKMGDALKGVAVEEGLSGSDPRSPAYYVAMGHLYFDSIESFQKAFGPHSKEIMEDLPNYTNIEPVIQISEVKM